MNKLVSDSFYHIYNRGNNKQQLFFKEQNYIFFLENFNYYLSHFLSVYAFCLLPNHFHFLVKTKSEYDFPDTDFGILIGQRFRMFFMKYAKAINKQMERTGSLFENTFKRKVICKETYLINAIVYIHLNPCHHDITADYENYKWSSYKRILQDRPTNLMKENVVNLFGGKDNFIKYHKDIEIIKDLKEFEEKNIL
jgi:putative transposase